MKPDLIAISDQIVPELVPIPADAPDVCPLCRSGRTGPGLCRSCTRTSAQVKYPSDLVIPISYYTTPSPLRERMHDYKEGTNPAVRLEQARIVAAVLIRYIAEHHDALIDRFGNCDDVVAVPSGHHDGPPALQTAIEDNFPNAIGPFARYLTRGPDVTEPHQASPNKFALTADEELTGRRILLIDDTFTTGASIQSAHHTLVAAGATVIAAVVVARKINPHERYGTDRLWERQVAVSFDFRGRPWWA